MMDFTPYFSKANGILLGILSIPLSAISLMGGGLDPKLNNTLITLIPKVEHPTSVKEFRPISLCSVVYKLVTKVAANRIRKVMPLLTLPFQSSFVAGRSITDNILITQEVIHSMRKKTIPRSGWRSKLI